ARSQTTYGRLRGLGERVRGGALEERHIHSRLRRQYHRGDRDSARSRPSRHCLAQLYGRDIQVRGHCIRAAEIPQLYRSLDPAEGKRLAQAASQLGEDFAADRGPAAQGRDRHTFEREGKQGARNITITHQPVKDGKAPSPPSASSATNDLNDLRLTVGE